MTKWLAFVGKFVVWTMAGAVVVAALVAMIAPSSESLQHAVGAQPVALPALAPLSQRSYVYDAAGVEIAELFSNEDRLPVSLKQIPTKLIDTVLATEDRDFYNHKGVNYKGIARAFINDVKGGKRQGGSTITQQLVKNTLFENGRKNTVSDKAKEAVWALRLESQMTKDQILERYLNTIYFGEGAYGVRAASERYFDKSDLNTLTYPEMALLAGLIASPESKNPIGHPQAARDRRDEVFKALVEVGRLTPADRVRYDAAPLPTTVYRRAQSQPTSYFVKAVQNWLVNGNNPAAQALGSTPRQREFRLYHGGLKIYTTWDRSLDPKLAAAVATGKLPAPVEAAITVIDNATGAVKAMYEGGRDFATSQYDLALQGRAQPGSQFKVFTLAAAIEAGYSPNDYINGGTCSCNPPVTTAHWAPSTDAGGLMSLRTALAKSVNCAFARLELSLGHGTIGPSRVTEMAHRLGVGSPLADVSSVTLGTSAVTTLDMARAFSVFPNDGIRRDSIFATKIVDSVGSVIYDSSRVGGKQVLRPEVARTMADMMGDVIKSGTAQRAQLANGRPAAGKTGTTNDDVALWFTGYTHELTTSVAVFIPDCDLARNLSFCALNHRFSGSVSVQGGRVAAPIWKAFMDSALEGRPTVDLVTPDQTLWPHSVYVTENGRPISAPYNYIPHKYLPSKVTTTTTPSNSPSTTPHT